jgi:hypothetical protein
MALGMAHTGGRLSNCNDEGAAVMKLWGNVAAIIAVIVGAVWILQGANLLGGSFMSGQSLWLYIGIVLAIAGAIGLWRVNSR